MTRRGHFHRFLRMIMLSLAVVYGVAALMVPARADDPAMEGCAAMLPYGRPNAWSYSDVSSSDDYFTVCHAGYVASFFWASVPRWVAYRLTADQVATCVPQTRPSAPPDAAGRRPRPKPLDAFRSDDLVPAKMRALPADYTSNQDKNIGYEPLQLVPAEDFPSDPAAVADSFILSNTVPQIDGMMNYTWNYLEATIRSWARERGELIIYTGPILAPFGRMITPHMPFPVAMWKVVIDPQRHEAITFIFQEYWMGRIQYSGLSYFQTSIDEVERWSHVVLPLPENVDRHAKPPIWPSDIGRLDKTNHARRVVCLETDLTVK